MQPSPHQGQYNLFARFSAGGKWYRLHWPPRSSPAFCQQMTWNTVPISWAETKASVHLDKPSRMQTEGRSRGLHRRDTCLVAGGEPDKLINNKSRLTLIYQWLILGHCLMDRGWFQSIILREPHDFQSLDLCTVYNLFIPWQSTQTHR